MTDCEADSQCCLFSRSWHVIKPHLLDWGIEWNVWLLTLCLPLEEGVDVCLLRILSFGAPEFKLLFKMLWIFVKLEMWKVPLNTQKSTSIYKCKCHQPFFLYFGSCGGFCPVSSTSPSEGVFNVLVSRQTTCSIFWSEYTGPSPSYLEVFGVFWGGDKGYWKCLCS